MLNGSRKHPSPETRSTTVQAYHITDGGAKDPEESLIDNNT